MDNMTSLFNSFLFPTALCILLLWFFYAKVWIRIELTLERVTKTNEELSESNRILSGETLKRLDDIDMKVDKIIKEKEGV